MIKDKVVLRLMTKDDASAVEIVEKACFKYPWSREAFWQEALNPQTIYLVVELEGEIRGYMGLWHIGDEGHITNVAIHPNYQGQGLGKLMVGEMLQICKDRGITACTLEVRPSNRPALKLYSSFGFRSVGDRPHYYEDGEAATIMWLTDLQNKELA